MQICNHITKIMILGIIFIHSSGCSPVQAPSFDTIKFDVLSKLPIYEEVNVRALQSRANRITRTEVIPKDIINEEETQWFINKFDELGLDIGIQVAKKESLVEFIYWTAGIVGSGQYLVVVKSENKITDTDYYGHRLANNLMACREITKNWYTCLS